MLQTLASATPDLDIGARATIEYGVLAQGVRHLIVCGHGRCRGDGDAQTAVESQDLLVARCRALLDDAYTGPILRRARVTMRALWFDEGSHDLYACHVEGRAARCMEDVELAAMFARFDELTA